jgi:hypothetical protein
VLQKHVDPDPDSDPEHTFNRLIQKIWCTAQYTIRDETDNFIPLPWVINTDVVDQHHVDADPDPTFLFDADSDPYPDPTKFYTCSKLLNFLSNASLHCFIFLITSLFKFILELC